jgi:hypothetical protein
VLQKWYSEEGNLVTIAAEHFYLPGAREKVTLLHEIYKIPIEQDTIFSFMTNEETMMLYLFYDENIESEESETVRIEQLNLMIRLITSYTSTIDRDTLDAAIEVCTELQLYPTIAY